MNIVLDTNIIVSAIWSPGKNASNIMMSVLSGRNTVCYDYRIMDEYNRVLHYEKFGFDDHSINLYLDPIISYGISVIPDPLPLADFTRDESDRKFFEVAKYCNAFLITGNLTHFPKEPFIITPSDFCSRFL